MNKKQRAIKEMEKEKDKMFFTKEKYAEHESKTMFASIDPEDFQDNKGWF
jgi:hypothetical protein